MECYNDLNHGGALKNHISFVSVYLTAYVIKLWISMIMMDDTQGSYRTTVVPFLRGSKLNIEEPNLWQFNLSLF